MNNESKKMMSLAGIKEGDKKFLKNESFLENEKKEAPLKDDDFIIVEFGQTDVAPNEDDEILYKLG